MPKYVYQGLETGVTFELDQRISDPALTTHPETGEPVKRLIGRPAIAFKGSGFYANDARSSAANSKPEAKSGASTDSSSGSEASSAAPASEGKSAEAKPAAPAPSPAKD